MVAAAIIALLVAKPWQQSSVPDLSPQPAANVNVADAPTLRPTTRPESEPTSGVFAVEIGRPGDVARCLYDQTRKGEWRLGAILVLPPSAVATGDSGTGQTRDVGWRVELQVNRDESLFTAEWRPVSESRLQVVRATDGSPAHFFPMEAQVDPSSVGRTTVFRAHLIVDWYSPNGAESTRTELIMPRYVIGGRDNDPVLPMCPGFTRDWF